MTPPLREWLGALPADVVRLPLSGLDQQATSELVRSVLAYEPPAGMPADLHARTGGNPLFVKECVRLLAAQGGSATLAVPDRVAAIATLTFPVGELTTRHCAETRSPRSAGPRTGAGSQ